ncbi:MAG: DUF1552 domain-containing protein [Myxococcota bacterium]
MRQVRRRAFLGGVGGAALGLPFLESVVLEDRTAAALNQPPVFTAFFKQGNGVQQEYPALGEPDRFWPSVPGPLTPSILRERDEGRAVSELADYADQLCIVSGVNLYYVFGTGHTKGLAMLLTGSPSEGRTNHERGTHESIDWFIERTCNPGSEPLYVQSGVSSSFTTTTASYRAAGEAYAAEDNPYATYLDLFGSGAPEVEDSLIQKRRSLNDLVRDELTDLMGASQLSSADRRRLSDHFELIRDIELRMCDRLPADVVAHAESLRDALGDDDNREPIMELFMDITAAAFACNLKRAAVLQMSGNSGDNTRYYIHGSNTFNYHAISHRRTNDGPDAKPIPDADLLHHEVDRIHGRLFRGFLDRLSGYSGPSGESLLYDCNAVWTNDIGLGLNHMIYNIPFVIAGSGGGFLRQGVYVDMGGVVTNNALLNTLISAHGIREANGDYYGSFGGPAELGTTDTLNTPVSTGGVLSELIA